MNDPFLKRYFPWLLLIGIALNVPGLFLDIIEPDGALYATIAKHIVLHSDWINLFGDGHDWLDKPHFPFWMAAISYKILGINGFAYKLPAFLFFLIGLRYTYLLGRDLYNADVARIAVLISAIALHSTLANFDVRAEPYLTTCIIAAIWHMLLVYRKQHGWHIVAAAFFAACAIMTKGIFVLLTISGGWAIFWLITGQFRELFNWRWWLMLAVCFFFIVPELYSLYVQFDLHPDKVVFGKTNVSGIRFFFWDSQFGRFFNTGPIKGKGSLTFFLHTTLWAFLPWSVSLIAGIFYLIRSDKDRQPVRWIVYGSALLTFILFSLSRFQLPHYLVILFPHFALISAYYLHQIAGSPKLRIFVYMQSGILVLTFVLIVGLLYMTGIQNAMAAALICGITMLASFFIPAKNPLQQLLYKAYAMGAITYLFLFLFFYPFLLQYQSGRQAAKVIPEEHAHIPAAEYASFSYSFEFYAPGDVVLIKNQKELQRYLETAPCYLYTTPAVTDSLLRAGVPAELRATPLHFHVTRLKGSFLNQKSRPEVLEPRNLLFIRKE
jgi:4-amino-4-deoxy-L-arabinose transferase-like glycosyltransferase